MAELQSRNGNANASNDQKDESAKIINWMILEGDDRVARSPSSSSSSSSSSDLNNDDVRNGSCGSSNGPLYELSDLLLQLPIKRGLSKYYQGKSQSFRNLRKVENINDFAKKMSRKKTRRRSNVKSYTSTPKAIIYKKSTSCFSFCKIDENDLISLGACATFDAAQHISTDC